MDLDMIDPWSSITTTVFTVKGNKHKHKNKQTQTITHIYNIHTHIHTQSLKHEKFKRTETKIKLHKRVLKDLVLQRYYHLERELKQK